MTLLGELIGEIAKLLDGGNVVCVGFERKLHQRLFAQPAPIDVRIWRSTVTRQAIALSRYFFRPSAEHPDFILKISMLDHASENLALAASVGTSALATAANPFTRARTTPPLRGGAVGLGRKTDYAAGIFPALRVGLAESPRLALTPIGG